MSKAIISASSFHRARSNKRHFGFCGRPSVSFPFQRVEIDWDRLIAKRQMLVESLDTVPKYLLKPEVLGLLKASRTPCTG